MDPKTHEFYVHILKVNTDFYEKIYQDAWLKDVFANVSKETITSQQTDFIVQVFGGPQNYCGRMPGDAHPHIFVDEEMWNLREKYLKEAFEMNQTPELIRAKWLKIDNSFKNIIIKKSVDDLKPRFRTDDLIIVKKAS